jgi:hypothetical protein
MHQNLNIATTAEARNVKTKIRTFPNKTHRLQNLKKTQEWKQQILVEELRQLTALV